MTGEPYAGMVLARFQDIAPECDEAVRSAWNVRAKVSAESVFAGIGELIPYGIWVCKPDGAVLYLSAS
ncbi:MAG: Putative PAS/PAC sensor protein, partial [Methanoculleus marisnigri]